MFDSQLRMSNITAHRHSSMKTLHKEIFFLFLSYRTLLIICQDRTIRAIG